jgi:spore germination protein GerM
MSAHGTGSKTKKLPLLAILFWMVFFIVVILLFIIQMPAIRKTLQSTRFIERLTNRPVTDETDVESSPAGEAQPADGVIFVEPSAVPEPPPVPFADGVSAENAPADDAAGQAATETMPPPALPAAETVSPPVRPAPEARERAIYFVKIDDLGMVYTASVKRRITVSDSPLLDVLNLLLRGPTGAERSQGFTSLIPDGVLVQNVRITGNTAVISFSENFMFNSYGAEGYVAQLRQIVWTATEFPNIHDVQILIEGRRIDFLGESIRIGRPISRDSL